MKEYLESEKLQGLVSEMMLNKPVAAICYGVGLAARSRRKDGKSILWDYKTTALLRSQEMTAWGLTRFWMGNYYRTNPESVQDEVTKNLADRNQFIEGPSPLKRDSPDNLKPGFFVKDKNFISARWPGDAHRFASEFLKMLV